LKRGGGWALIHRNPGKEGENSESMGEEKLGSIRKEKKEHVELGDRHKMGKKKRILNKPE